MHPYGGHRTTWVATPPPGPGALPVRPLPRRVRYAGPPAYPAPPRWGFPRLAWRAPTSVPGTVTREPHTPEGVARFARRATTVLWMVAISALLAGGGEVWRYVLLLLGRAEALPADVVDVSDALVNTGAALAAVTGVVCLVLVPRWLLAAREVASSFTDERPARPDWQVLLGVLLPGLNLFVAGAVLAELEHTALGLRGDVRPRPSRLVLAWWGTWAAGVLLAILTLLLDLRTGVDSRANGVVWYAMTDLVAVAVAVLTVLVINSITGFLAPGALSARQRVVSVHGAPQPPLRPARPTGAVR